MNDAIKYFSLGFVFYFLFGFVFSFLFSYSFSYFFTGLSTAVVIAIGLIKGPRPGLVFASSSLVVNLIADYFFLYYVYSFPAYYALALMGNFLGTSIQVSYGYLPSKLYGQQRRTSGLLAGFFAAFILDLFLTIVFGVIFGFPRMNSSIWNLILGALSAGLCARYLKSLQPPISMPSPTPVGRYGPSTIRCSNCSYENPSSFEYCGKCGTPLKEEETRIY